ncbi:MAG: cytochrome b [Woeseiaceae bacterium]
MGLGNTTTEWGSMAKALHWLVAAGIFALIWLGLQQSGMERGPEKTEIRALHGSIALLVFVLMSARLLLRLTGSAPAHPPGMPGWQRLSSAVVHWGLYLSVFVQLFAGAMTVATTGNGLPFFGLFSLPLPVAQSEDGHHFWEEIHETVWIAIAVLLIVHVLAALYNHFIVKNDVLRRMTVGVKS